MCGVILKAQHCIKTYNNNKVIECFHKKKITKIIQKLVSVSLHCIIIKLLISWHKEKTLKSYKIIFFQNVQYTQQGLGLQPLTLHWATTNLFIKIQILVYLMPSIEHNVGVKQLFFHVSSSSQSLSITSYVNVNISQQHIIFYAPALHRKHFRYTVTFLKHKSSNMKVNMATFKHVREYKDLYNTEYICTFCISSKHTQAHTHCQNC